jgi:hypothetical protein
VAALVVLVVGWAVRHHVNASPLRFEHSNWVQAREDEDWRMRTRMATDLVNRRNLIGQNRTQLIQLLGNPEKYSDATDQQLYYLVREDWDWIDPVRVDNLLISLDQDGRAVNATIAVLREGRINVKLSARRSFSCAEFPSVKAFLQCRMQTP